MKSLAFQCGSLLLISFVAGCFNPPPVPPDPEPAAPSPQKLDRRLRFNSLIRPQEKQSSIQLAP
ncbi:MAG UNVERIFIED_CONTAM: hypothetical protein LVR18_11590 [Planctomycetaceae bacterium]|jgi:hypothetical protein